MRIFLHLSIKTILIILFIADYALCKIRPYSLKQEVSLASIIVSGRVKSVNTVGSYIEKGDSRTNLPDREFMRKTAKFRINRIFKGSINSTEIYIDFLEDTKKLWSPMPTVLNKDENLILFLKPVYIQNHFTLITDNHGKKEISESTIKKIEDTINQNFSLERASRVKKWYSRIQKCVSWSRIIEDTDRLRFVDENGKTLKEYIWLSSTEELLVGDDLKKQYPGKAVRLFKEIGHKIWIAYNREYVLISRRTIYRYDLNGKPLYHPRIIEDKLICIERTGNIKWERSFNIFEVRYLSADSNYCNGFII